MFVCILLYSKWFSQKSFKGKLVVLYTNIDLKLQSKFHRPMHYKIGVTCVYNEHVFYTLLYQHDSLIHLFHNSIICVMNSRMSMFPYTNIDCFITTNTLGFTCNMFMFLGRV